MSFRSLFISRFSAISFYCCCSLFTEETVSVLIMILRMINHETGPAPQTSCSVYFLCSPMDIIPYTDSSEFLFLGSVLVLLPPCMRCHLADVICCFMLMRLPYESIRIPLHTFSPVLMCFCPDLQYSPFQSSVLSSSLLPSIIPA